MLELNLDFKSKLIFSSTPEGFMFTCPMVNDTPGVAEQISIYNVTINTEIDCPSQFFKEVQSLIFNNKVADGFYHLMFNPPGLKKSVLGSSEIRKMLC